VQTGAEQCSRSTPRSGIGSFVAPATYLIHCHFGRQPLRPFYVADRPSVRDPHAIPKRSHRSASPDRHSAFKANPVVTAGLAAGDHQLGFLVVVNGEPTYSMSVEASMD